MNQDLLDRQIAEYNAAIARRANQFVAANGGKELPYETRGGMLVQYVFNPATGEHAYYDVRADLILDHFDPMEA